MRVGLRDREVAFAPHLHRDLLVVSLIGAGHIVPTAAGLPRRPSRASGRSDALPADGHLGRFSGSLGAEPRLVPVCDRRQCDQRPYRADSGSLRAAE